MSSGNCDDPRFSLSSSLLSSLQLLLSLSIMMLLLVVQKMVLQVVVIARSVADVVVV